MQQPVSDDAPTFADRYKRVKFVHYYTVPWEDAQTGTPRPLMIGVRDFATGKMDLFAVHTLAELRGFGPSEILGKIDQLEKGILEGFYECVQANRRMRWLHWGMDGPVWGVPALAHRFRALGGQPPDIPEQKLCNLAAALKLTYGDHYAPHPRLPSLAGLNGLNVHGWFQLAEVQAAARAGEFTRMALSLRRQLSVMADVFALFVTGQLRHQGDPSVTCPLRSLMLGSSRWAIPPSASTQRRDQARSTGLESGTETGSVEEGAAGDERGFSPGGRPPHGDDSAELLKPAAQRPEQPHGGVESNGESGQTETGDDREHSRWLTVSDAARVADANTGILTRAVDAGEIRSNGKRGRQRRIDAVDLSRWVLARTNKPEPEESDEQVERLVDRHCKG